MVDQNRIFEYKLLHTIAYLVQTHQVPSSISSVLFVGSSDFRFLFLYLHEKSEIELIHTILDYPRRKLTFLNLLCFYALKKITKKLNILYVDVVVIDLFTKLPPYCSMCVLFISVPRTKHLLISVMYFLSSLHSWPKI